MEDPHPIPQSQSHSPFPGPGVGGCNSPEFEFWMVSNPSFPQPNLLSADELFSGGFLLPLHQRQHSDEPSPPPPPPFPPPQPESPSAAASRRWTQIFKINEKKTSDSVDQAPKDRKRLTRAGVAVTAAELNINLWPFSRSRSTGTGGSGPSTAAPARKVSSAPCSRSNSTGEPKSRKLGHSPSRGAGVHLGRTSPVWKIPRNNSGARRSNEISGKITEKDSHPCSKERPKKMPGSRTRVLSLNVPICIGYRNHVTCSRDQKNAIGVAASATAIDSKTSDAGVEIEGVRKSSLLGIRNLFTKKVY